MGQSASPSNGGQTSGATLTAHQVFCHQTPIGPSGLTCRPRFLPLPTSGQSVAETLQAMEVRWVASIYPSSRGTARLSSEMSASLPAWMTPSQTPRMHWSDRQQQGQEQHPQFFLPSTVTYMCHDMTGLAIMAGRLGGRTFCLFLARLLAMD